VYSAKGWVYTTFATSVYEEKVSYEEWNLKLLYLLFLVRSACGDHRTGWGDRLYSPMFESALSRT